MPIVPECADCKPLSQPQNASDYVTLQEVRDSISTSNSVQSAFLEVKKGQTVSANFVTRQPGRTGFVVLIPLSGDPNLYRIFGGSAAHPDFDWRPISSQLRPGASIESQKFLIPFAEPLTVQVTSAAALSKFVVLYSET